jgi:hypothetical protein
MKFPFWILLLALAFGLAACDDDEPRDTVALSLSAKAVVSAARADGDITVNRARLIVEELELDTDDDDSASRDEDPDDSEDSDDSTEFETGPILLELVLDGSVNEVLVSNIPAGIYDEVEFEIDKLDDDEPEDVDVLDDPQFADFVGDKRYSMIIEGTVEDGGSAVDFTFRSQLSAEQEYGLIPPMVLESDDNDANLTLVIDTTMWFSDGSGGVLDPRDPADAERIESNIIASIEVFEDDDEDGEDDDD